MTPEPPYPPNTYYALEPMPIDAQTLLDADIFKIEPLEAQAAAIRLFLASWCEMPTGSLPGGYARLHHMSGAKVWSESIQNAALTGWHLASDGRFYRADIAMIVGGLIDRDARNKRRTANALAARHSK